LDAARNNTKTHRCINDDPTEIRMRHPSDVSLKSFGNRKTFQRYYITERMPFIFPPSIGKKGGSNLTVGVYADSLVTTRTKIGVVVKAPAVGWRVRGQTLVNHFCLIYFLS